MRFRTDPASTGLALFGAIALLSGSAAGGEIGYRQASSTDTTLTMLAVDGGVEITNGDSTQTLQLSSGTWMQAIERLGDSGWVATGTADRITGRKLLLKGNMGAGVVSLPAPKVERGAIAWWPLPMVHHGQLVGLVWFEGRRMDRLSVVAARWNGKAFSTPTIVSPPETGSQAGMTATVLDDGGWLLAWSSYDGEDDEVIWSLGDGRRFSRPVLVSRANSVADILPDLLSDGRGALLAWSQEAEDQYVLRLARFNGRSWIPLQTPVTGAVAPQLLRREGEAWLSIWSHDRGSPEWVLSRLDGGRAVAVDRVAGDQLRPAMTAVGHGPPRLQGASGHSGGGR